MGLSTHAQLCGLTLAVAAAGLGSCSREPEEGSRILSVEISATRHFDPLGVRPLWNAVEAVLERRGFALAVRMGLMLDDEGRVFGTMRFDEKAQKGMSGKEWRALLGDSLPGRVIATHPDGTQLDVELKPQDTDTTHLQYKIVSLPGSKPISIPGIAKAIKWFIPAVLQQLGDAYTPPPAHRLSPGGK